MTGIAVGDRAKLTQEGGAELYCGMLIHWSKGSSW